MEKVLIVGANGNTGSILIDILKNHGQYEPVAMIRDESQKDKFTSKGADYLVADLEGDLSGVFNQIDKVIFAAGSGASTGPEKTKSVDEEGAIKLINEAKKANLKKFVMLSSMGADNPESNEDLKVYLEAKHNADEHLKSSGLNYCIIRPGHLTNNEGKGHIEASNKLGHYGEIAREDVARVLISSLDHSNTHNKTIEILSGNETIEEALSELSMA